MRKAAVLFVVAAIVSCGGSSGGDGGGRSIDSPCDLADPGTVAAAFGGSVSEGVEGVARNCDFTIEASDIASVSVFLYGDASGWDGLRGGFEDNRGGTTDVAGVGDAAFYPNDRGPAELVVRAGGYIFSVSVFVPFGEAPPGTADEVQALAASIAASLSG